MRKISLLFASIFLVSAFLFPWVNADEYHVPIVQHYTNFSTIYDLGSGATKAGSPIKGWAYGDKYYFTYVLDADEKIYVEEFNSVFNSLQTDSDNCEDSGGCEYAECNILPLSSTAGKTIQCIGLGDDPAPRTGTVYVYTMGNTSMNMVYSDNDMDVYMESATVADKFATGNYPYMFWFYGDGNKNDPRYAKSYTIADAGGAGWVLVPDKYEISTSGGTQDDIAVAQCGGGYLMFILNASTNRMSILQFDSSLDYKYGIEDINSTWNWEKDRWGIYGDPFADYVQFVATNASGLIGFWSFHCSEPHEGQTNYNVIQSNVQIFNQTMLVSDWNSTTDYITKPYLSRDINGTRWVLYYELYDSGSYYRKAAVEGTGCEACHWVATDECAGTLQKYERDCPLNSDCDDLYEWNETSNCINQDNITQQSRPWSDSRTCYGSEVYGGSSECNIEGFKIPADCVNVSVRYESVYQVKYKERSDILYRFLDLFGSPENMKSGSGFLQACSPSVSSSCASTDLDCQYFNNITAQPLNVTYDASDYYWPGSTVSGYSLATVDSSCLRDKSVAGIWNVLDWGVESIQVRGQAIASCVQPCEQKWVCLTQGTTESEVRYEKNCIQNVSTLAVCPSGCDAGTGRCIAEPSWGANENRMFSLAWWSKLIAEPSKDQKLFLGFGGALLFAIAVSFVMSSVGALKTSIPLMFFMSFGVGIVIVVAMGLVSAIVLVLIIAGVIAYTVLKNM